MVKDCLWCGKPIPQAGYGNRRYCGPACRAQAKKKQVRDCNRRIAEKSRTGRTFRCGPRRDDVPASPPPWVAEVASAGRILPLRLQGLMVGGPFERLVNLYLGGK